MSVAVAIDPTQRTPLVQVSDLDPQELIRFQATVTADVSGGVLQLDCDAPTDTSVLWIYAGGVVFGGSTSDFQFNIVLDGNTIIRHGAEGFQIGGSSLCDMFRPPGILLSPQDPGGRSTMQLITDNVDGDSFTGSVYAFTWEAQVGRNLPQKFFWPGFLN